LQTSYWRNGLGTLTRLIMPTAVALSGAAGGCGIERPFADAAPEPSNQRESEAYADASLPVPVQSGPSGGQEGGAPSPVAGPLNGDVAANGSGASVNCGVDGGSCPPLPFADAGLSSGCPGCLVNNNCVAANAVDPENPCQICEPLRNSTNWSANNGIACDDGILCTINDACSGGRCSGLARECDDGVACNGVSTCDETSGECTAAVNQCGASMACDIESGVCISTCNGCLIDGICIAEGSPVGGNPCLVCTPAISTTAPSPALGKSCGSPPGTCSEQDTCDGQGRCLPNNLPLDSPCGNPASSACDEADRCDGIGNCLQRIASNGDPCEDGSFCTVGDRCQGGQCLPTGGRNCGGGSTCDEGADQCRCQGCSVAGTCFGVGESNPANPCQVCDPGRNSVAFSINENALCGDGRTCNAQGQCITVLQQPLGVPCAAASECSSGFCRLWFRDIDGDGHGADQTAMLCSPNPVDDDIESQASGAIFATFIDINGVTYSALGDDCCDSLNAGGNQVFEGNTNPFRTPQLACSNVLPFDYDCSGEEEDQFFFTTRAGVCSANCVGGIWVEPIPSCGQMGPLMECRTVDGVCTMVESPNSIRVCL
jgi:hypothetical protein